MAALQDTTPTGLKCAICDQDIGGASLKCGGAGKPGCGKFTHLKCSELPAYMLVKFKKTRSSYHCPTCVEADVGDTYQECIDRFRQELHEEEVHEDDVQILIID